MPDWSWDGAWARRLHRHALSAPAPDAALADAALADVAAAMCGAHAQVMSAAELSLGLRTAGTTRVDVRDALWRERSIVKTRGPRGTVHLLAARDLPLWTGALSAVPYRDPFPADQRLGPGQVDEIVAAIAGAVADRELTVDELTVAVVAATGAWAGEAVMEAFGSKWPRWRQVEHLATNRGVLCFGPNRGRNVTYTSPRRWLPGFRPAAAPDALAWLVTRYLSAYGPATPAQFAQWLGAPRGWATDLFGTLAGELDEVEVEGTRGWVVRGEPPPDGAPSCDVRLLPYFDAYAVGCHPRERLFPGPAAERALSGGQSGTIPVLLVGGTVAGIWHHKRAGRHLDVTVEVFGRLTRPQRQQLDEQVQRVGGIVEVAPRLTLGPAPVKPHA